MLFYLISCQRELSLISPCLQMFYMLKYNMNGVNLNNIEVAKMEDSLTKCIIDLQTRFPFANNCKLYTEIRLHYPNISFLLNKYM